MKHIIVTILISFCTLNICPQTNDIIPLTSERNRTLVSVKIGNTVIPDIILDTGLPFDGVIIYNPDYRDSLEMNGAVEVKIPGAGQGDASNALMLDSSSFFLGKNELKNQRIILLTSDTYKGFPSNGIIGYSIFGHYAVEIDYDANTLMLHNPENFTPEKGWTEVPIYFRNNNIPWVDASVVIKDENPIPLSFYIDFAAGDAILLLEKDDMKFSLPDETEEVYIGRGMSGDIYGRKGFISKFVIGNFELTKVYASFASEKVRSKQKNADGVIGNGSLRRFNIIFDYAGKKLYLKPNSYFNEPFN